MAAILAATYLGLTVSTWITLASIAYQVTQARKMRKQAQAAAEARKGYELVVEGEGVTLPIVYGRAKIGGVRSYHNTSNNFVMATPNSDKVFLSSGFDTNVEGRSNEFLFFQQAMCQGPINRVYDVVLEESRYLDDPDLSTTQTITTSAGDGENVPYTYTTSSSVKSGLRIDLHYGDTPIADAVMTANNPERVNAIFTQIKDQVGLAYASVCIKLDRDDPALNGVPTVQFFIEGKKVKDITRSGSVGNYTYAISSTRAYSNNPALCLLDYLLDDTSGKGLDNSLIDLESFYNAKLVCDTTVLSNASIGGKIYKPTTGTLGAEGVTTSNTRTIRLYECNAIIDTQKPLRENVESILSTMGDARLIWSGGKYKLSIQYPTTNSNIVLANTLTDDDLIIDDNVSINWPTSSERLNHCTVRFHNESENFKEDTVSWPPKETGVSLRGVGGFKYPQSVDDAWNDSVGGVLLKKYSVWSGSGSSFDQTWKFFVKETGAYTFEFTGDNSATASITTTTGTVLYSGAATDWQATTTGTVTLTKDTEYRIRLTAQDSGGTGKGIAGKLSKGSFIYWTTRSDNYTSLISINNSNAVYTAMKLEDNDLDLETDIFADGITDYYHALAKAEELVRTSRTAFGIKFKYVIKDKFLEPGDFIKLSSQTLKLGVDTDLYLRINEVKITDEAVCEINATRFDYTQLAWNVDDNEYIKALNVYSFDFGTPSNLLYIAETAQILNSSGRLEWTGIPDTSKLDCYITYYHFPGNVTGNGEVIWTELGRTTDTQYILPPLTLDQTIFGVRALSKGGKLSDIAVTGVVSPIFATAFSGKSVKLKGSGRAFVKQANSSVIAPTAILFSVNVTGFDAPNYKWYINEVLQAGQTSATFSLPSFIDVPTKDIKVRVTEGTSTTFLEDFETVYFINAGSDSYAIGLSEASLNLTCNSDGVPEAGQLPQAITIDVYKGATPVTTGIVYTLNPVGCTLQSNTTTNGVFTITAVDDPYARVDIDATITAASLTLSITLRIAKSTAAATRIVTLDPDRLAFVYPSNSNNPDYASINIYAREEAFDDPRYVWDIDGVNPGVSNTTSMINLLAFPSGQTRNISVEVYESTDTNIRRFDSITMYSVKDGSNAYNFDYVDANRTIGTDPDGNILPDFLPLIMTPLLFRGTSNIANTITTPANTNTVSFSVVGTPVNLNVSVNASTGIVTVSQFTGPLISRVGSAIIRATVTSDGSIHEKKIVINKAADGADGLDAPVVNLTSNGIAFIQPKNTTSLADVFPATIEFTASAEGIENPRYTWFVDTVEVVPSGTVATYSVPKYIGQPKLVKVIVTSSTDPTVNVYDQVTIFSVKDGDDSYNATLTNENKTLRYTAAGVLSPNNQLPFYTTMQVARGASYITSGLTFYLDPEITPTNLTASINETTGLVTVSAISSDIGKATFIAKIGTTVVGRKELIVNKSIDGKDGTSPYSGSISNDSQGLPSNETGAVTSYEGATGQFTVYKGAEIAAGVTYEYESSTGFITPPVGTINSLGIYQITTGVDPSPTVNIATVTYIAKVGTEIVARKIFSLTKMKSSSIYKISPNVTSLVYDSVLLTYAPTTLTFDAQVKSGNNPYSAYPGKIEIQRSADGTTWTTIGSASDNTTSKTITVDSSSVPLTTKFVRGVLYLAGSNSVVDTQSLLFLQTVKGDKGLPGIPGVRGIAILTWAVTTSEGATDIPTACQAALNNAYISPDNTARSGDRVTLFNNTSATKWSKTYLYNGSSWGLVTLYVDGSAVITGTLSTSALAIGNTTGANRILLTDSQLIVYGSDNQKRVVIGNLAI